MFDAESGECTCGCLLSLEPFICDLLAAWLVVCLFFVFFVFFFLLSVVWVIWSVLCFLPQL